MTKIVDDVGEYEPGTHVLSTTGLLFPDRKILRVISREEYFSRGGVELEEEENVVYVENPLSKEVNHFVFDENLRNPSIISNEELSKLEREIKSSLKLL